MKINLFLLQLAITMLVIFGGAFSIHYFITGELLLDQLIGTIIGFVLLISSLILRRKQLKKA